MAVTIKNTAKKVRVSYLTMFRALNDIRTGNTENKKQTSELTREVGYVSSRAAINLKLSRSHTIGLHFSATGKMSSSFVPYDMLAGVYSTVGNRYNAVVKGIDIYEKSMLSLSLYSGVIVLSQRMEDGEFIEEAMAKNIPMVVICWTVFYDVPSVVTDETKAIEVAMDYLLEHGHRKTGVIEGDPNLDSTRLRKQERRNSILKHGLDPSDLPVEIGNYRHASGYQMARKLVEEHQGLTAILRPSNEMAFTVKAATYETGLTMPDDISLIGFDNRNMLGYGNTKLTTMECSMGGIAKEEARALLRRLKNGIMDNRRTYLDNKLIIWETIRDIG